MVKRLKELRSKRELLQERLTDLIDVSRCETKISKQKFNQSVKRLSQKFIMENKLKGRKLGAGARRRLDDEEFIARAVESKSTSHGRRHYAILYTGHRVKYRDLLSLANHSLYKKGKRLIRSASTVYNRGRPERINSVQAKKNTLGIGYSVPRNLLKLKKKDMNPLITKEPVLRITG